jgi:hypothetical protein
MLRNIKQLYENKLGALDGDIGHVKDFYFDDQHWAIRNRNDSRSFDSSVGVST